MFSTRYAYNRGMSNTNNKETAMTTARRGRCQHCAQPITEKLIGKASDATSYINEYGTYDDELVWVAKDGKAICFSHGAAHITSKEWYSAQ